MIWGIRCYENGKFSHWYHRHGVVQRYDDKRVAEDICEVVNQLFEGAGPGENCRLEVGVIDLASKEEVCGTCRGLGTVADEDLHAGMASMPCPTCSNR